MEITATAAACLVVGLLISWSGVAGFLLPILFVNFNHLTARQALALSFLCFAVSGAIGAFGYHRKGQLTLRTGLLLGSGSLAGAALGAAANQLLPTATVKTLLYMVVLLSGLSILVRQLMSRQQKGPAAASSPSPAVLIPLGLVTGALCALSGAGGPVVVMPLLVALGVPAKDAVGVALLDSVFIALPALGVYGLQGGFTGLWPLAAVCAAAHGMGVAAGSATSHLVPQEGLKRGVAVFSICFSLYMLLL